MVITSPDVTDLETSITNKRTGLIECESNGLELFHNALHVVSLMDDLQFFVCVFERTASVVIDVVVDVHLGQFRQEIIASEVLFSL